jgi:hypothetical protein
MHNATIQGSFATRIATHPRPIKHEAPQLVPTGRTQKPRPKPGNPGLPRSAFLAPCARLPASENLFGRPSVARSQARHDQTISQRPNPQRHPSECTHGSPLFSRAPRIPLSFLFVGIVGSDSANSKRIFRFRRPWIVQPPIEAGGGRADGRGYTKALPARHCRHDHISEFNRSMRDWSFDRRWLYRQTQTRRRRGPQRVSTWT